MGGGKGGSNEAAKAREEEQRRQEKIRVGTRNVNAIFDGGTYKPILDQTDRGLVFGDEEQREGQFTDDFFEGRRKSFLDYYTPQVEDQYSDAQRELTFALARGGNLNSSTRGEQVGDLQKLYDTQTKSIADQALAHENQARTSVEDTRSNLIATLNATGDAQGAVNSALSRAAVLSKPSAYDPLGQLFVDFTSGLGTQAALERAEAASGGQYKPRYNTGLFGNTGRVTVRD